MYVLMKSDKGQFNTLLSKYVFGVTEACIAEVDVKTQNRLVKLFIDIDKDSPETSAE